jgi:hypothetical protein
LTGPVAYTADTIATAHTGSIPTAGPATAQGLGGAGLPGGGAGVPGGGTAFRGGDGGGGRPSGGGSTGGRPTTGGGFPGGAAGSASGARDGVGAAAQREGGALTGAGGAGGGGVTTSAALVRALESDASHYKWVAAVEGSQSAASIELATSGDAVMAIGGFNGQGGNLSLSAFKAYVEKGEIHYYIAGSSGGGVAGGGRSSSAIADWVASHFTAKTIGGQTVYDLTSSASSASS